MSASAAYSDGYEAGLGFPDDIRRARRQNVEFLADVNRGFEDAAEGRPYMPPPRDVAANTGRP